MSYIALTPHQLRSNQLTAFRILALVAYAPDPVNTVQTPKLPGVIGLDPR
jgi:hypothetical protein